MTRVTFIDGPLAGAAVRIAEEGEPTWDMFHEGVWHRYRLDFQTSQATYMESLVPSVRTNLDLDT